MTDSKGDGHSAPRDQEDFREAHLRRMRDASPDQRLEWLEEILEIAWASWALPRRDRGATGSGPAGKQR